MGDHYTPGQKARRQYHHCEESLLVYTPRGGARYLGLPAEVSRSAPGLRGKRTRTRSGTYVPGKVSPEFPDELNREALDFRGPP